MNYIKCGASLEVYKKKAAARINLITPEIKHGERVKYCVPGGILINMAEAVGDDSYDWINGITIVLKPLEIPILIRLLENGKSHEKDNIFHDSNKGKQQLQPNYKNLTVAVDPTGAKFLNLNQTSNDMKKFISLHLSTDEITGIVLLLKTSMSNVLGWNADFILNEISNVG